MHHCESLFFIALRIGTSQRRAFLQITGKGDKAFCAGMDLVNWNKTKNEEKEPTMPETGFGGLSNRAFARKPVIAAVNGYALGIL